MKPLLIYSLIFALMSFASKKDASITSSLTGTYGVCGCEKPNNTLPMLDLQEDGSFIYRNIYSAGEVFEAKGKWTMQDKQIRLIEHKSMQSFHDTWKSDPGFPCLKSRNGLSFFRLCKLDAC